MEAERPNASDSLRNAHGRKETLSRKTKCSVFVHIIFSPFMISSGFHFNISLYSENAGQTPWCYVRLRLLYCPKGADCVDIIACYRRDRPRTSASSCRTVRSRPRFPHLRTGNRMVARRRDHVRVMWPCQSTSFEWSVIKYVQYLITSARQHPLAVS